MKKLFSSTKAYLLLAGAAALMASCQDYEPANEQMTKEAAYNYEFERQFGPVDPNHDWSMATRVTANIDLSDAPEGTYEVKIFSEKNGYLLTKAIVENSAQISFDAIKGESSVRILARKTSALGLSVINGYFPIVDGEVNTAKEGTRASTADNCETTVGTQIDLGTKRMQVASPAYQAATENGYFEGAVSALPTNVEGRYYITTKTGANYSEGGDGKYTVKQTQNGVNVDLPDMDMYEVGEIVYPNGNNWEMGDFRLYKTKSNGMYDIAGGAYVKPACYATTTSTQNVKWAGDFYYLNDVYKSIDQETRVLFDDLLPLVSSSHPDPIFHEAEDNRAKWEDKLDFDVELVLTEDGPMTYTYVFYGSIYHNMLGYFYWNETEGMTPEQIKQARINAPRYVLMDDTYPSVVQSETGKPNLQCYGDHNGTNPLTPGGMDMPQWVDGAIDYHSGHKLQGTTYHMAYFGENYDQAGSYTFPAGTHVAFFLLTKATSNDANAGNKGTGLFYSIQDMNEDQEVFHFKGDMNNYYILNEKHWWSSSTDPNSVERMGVGEVAAVFYSYKGNMVLGFEDDLDKDENDMLFLISAPVDPPVELTTEEEITWIVACEDLGGTYDYDFNDLVFEVTLHTTTTETIINQGNQGSGTVAFASEVLFRPLAAGGTLPAKVYLGETEIGEIHALLGGSGTSTSTPINVGPKGSSVSLSGLNPTQVDTGETYYTSIAGVLEDIKIVVTNEGDKDATEITAPNQDKTSNIPQMLLLPKGWDWPTEQTHIYNVYPDFENWATDMTKNGWIKDPSKNSIDASYYMVNPFE